MKQIKKTAGLFVLVLSLCISTQSFSQTLKEFFNDKTISLTYLGIDYYHNRLINDPGGNPADIQGRLYASMNDVVIAEIPKNYDFADAFDRDGDVSADISAVTSRNKKINADDIRSSNVADFSRLTAANIATEVKALDIKDKAGVGLVFIMEGMNKEEKKGYGAVWVTLVNMKTKTVLMTERMEQEATGIGFRNYWVSIIKKTVIEIDKKKYKAWKEQHGG